MMKHGKNDEQIDELVRRLNALLAEKVDDQTISITPRGASKFSSWLKKASMDGECGFRRIRAQWI